MRRLQQSSSRPSRPCRNRRRSVALLAALTMASVTVAGADRAQAVPSPAGPAGTIQTMGGATRNFQQGGYGPDGVLATESQFLNPRGLGFAPNGDIYIGDALNHRVRKIDAAGVVRAVAGSGSAGYFGDGGAAWGAGLNEPHGVAVDSHGNVYIADSKNCVIRKVDTGGIITTFAGTGEKDPNSTVCEDSASDPVSVTNPLTVGLDQPKSLYMTKEGATDVLWVTDTGNSMLRRIDIHNGVAQTMTRVAGTRQSSHFGGDGGDAVNARLRHAEGIWMANDGTVYFTDSGNNLVRKIAMPVAPGAGRIITTIAGDKAAATANASNAADLAGNSDGDGDLAIDAHLDKPRGITGDNHGNLYIAEHHGSRIRRIKLNAAGGPTIDTVAGDGTFVEQRANGGSAFIKGENGPALDTQFSFLHDIQLNPADGSLWIADSRNNRVRAISDVANAPGRNVRTGGGVMPPAVRPGAPTSVKATPGNGSATVTWVAPADTGGSTITSYTVTSSAGQAASVDGALRSAIVTGLSNDTSYTFRVHATNTVGDSAASAPSNSVAPTTAAGPPITPPGAPITPPGAPTIGPATGTAAAGRSGYWMVGSDGTVFPFGDAKSFGNAATSSAVDLEPTPSGNGYWIVDDIGRVFTFGDAGLHGNVDRNKLSAGEKVTSLSASGDGGGYWIFTSRGRVLAFGNAAHLGDVSTVTLAGPVLDSIVTPSGQGYYMVASDGGIFAFGDAKFYGSMGGQKLNAPVQSLVPDSDGVGYWLVASDGGIFAFSADFKGSMGSSKLNRPVTGMVRSGTGYLMVGEDGGIFDFSGSPDGFKGSLGANPPANPIVSVAVLEN